MRRWLGGRAARPEQRLAGALLAHWVGGRGLTCALCAVLLASGGPASGGPTSGGPVATAAGTGSRGALLPREGSAWVSWVMDGDTVLLVPDGGGEPLKWRLQDIDAPERCQAGGEAARDALISMVHRQSVQYVWRAQDSYGRQIGRLIVQGQDVGAELVRSGHAWAYSYRTGRGPHAALQRQAQRERRGLFAAEAQPLSPALFRQFQGSCHEEGRPPAPVQNAPARKAQASTARDQR